MSYIIKKAIQEELANVANIAASFCYNENRYYDECNRSSRDYNSEAARNYMSRALRYAREMQSFCDSEGYDIHAIYPECSSFLDSYDKPQNW